MADRPVAERERGLVHGNHEDGSVKPVRPGGRRSARLLAVILMVAGMGLAAAGSVATIISPPVGLAGVLVGVWIAWRGQARW